MNFFQKGIPLGRWFGITVMIHWTFFATPLLFLWQDHFQKPGEVLLLTALLFPTVLLHEFGHALSCKAVGGKAVHIILWPLGGIAFIQPPGNAWAWLLTTVCGPLVNAVLWPAFYFISKYGLPVLAQHMDMQSLAFRIIWFSCLNLVLINKWLLIFNLIPAYPMDGGRILQEILWLLVGYARSLEFAGMVGVVAGGAFLVLGAGLTQITIPIVNLPLGGQGQDWILMAIGYMCLVESWGIYQRSRELQSKPML
jgi:Zn-dependent protease